MTYYRKQPITIIQYSAADSAENENPNSPQPWEASGAAAAVFRLLFIELFVYNAMPQLKKLN